LTLQLDKKVIRPKDFAHTSSCLQSGLEAPRQHMLRRLPLPAAGKNDQAIAVRGQVVPRRLGPALGRTQAGFGDYLAEVGVAGGSFG
jgi:hypothetical protein